MASLIRWKWGGTKETELALGILGWTGLWEKASVGPQGQGELAL